jgi:hypothetical protein
LKKTSLYGSAELLSEPPQAETIAGRLISIDGSDNKVQIGCNILPLPHRCQRQIFRQKPSGAAAYLDQTTAKSLHL